jgi:uncharacterized membrane protein YccC
MSDLTDAVAATTRAVARARRAHNDMLYAQARYLESPIERTAPYQLFEIARTCSHIADQEAVGQLRNLLRWGHTI